MLSEVRSDSSILLATDSQTLEETLAGASKVTVQTCVCPEGNFLQRACSLLQNVEGNSDETILIVNHQNLEINQDVVSGFIDKHLSAPSLPAVSVTPPEDHPFQLQNHINFVDAGMLYLVDTGDHAKLLPAETAALEPAAVSQPFPFNWEIALEAEENDLFAIDKLGRLAPAEDGAGVIWFKQTPDSARILWLGADLPSDMLALPADTAHPELATTLRLTANGIMLRSPDLEAACIVMVPVSASRCHPDQSRRYDIRNGRCRFDRPALETTAYLYVIEENAGENCLDVQYDFNPDGQLWERGYCLTSGRKITGRQNFPKVYIADHSLYMGSRSQLEKLDKAIRSGSIKGIPIGQRTTLLIKSELDWLRYQARQKEDSVRHE